MKLNKFFTKKHHKNSFSFIKLKSTCFYSSISSAFSFDDFVRIKFSDNKVGDFHNIWLRHNCPNSVHPKTRERTINPSFISPHIAPIKINHNQDELIIDWNDSDRSVYQSNFLHENIYGRSEISDMHVSGILKHRYKFEKECTIDWSEVSNKAKMAKLIELYGILIVKNGPSTPEDSLMIARDVLGGNLVETHFGLIEDLRVQNTTNKNNDQLGYTNAPVLLHTDQCFLENPPTLQLLHCISPSECGGGLSQFVDGKSIGKFMRNYHPLEYHLLSTIPVVFHRKQKNFESIHVSPIFRVKDEEIEQVRVSYFTMDPFKLPFYLMKSFYHALSVFEKICYSHQFLYSYSLQKGDFVLYDNHRMLHSRTGFTGVQRFLRGIYLERDDVMSHLLKK